LYVGIERGKMAALDPTDLSVKWIFPPDTKEGDRLKLEGIYGAPAVSKDTVYFGAHDGSVYAVDAESGALRWTFKTDDPIVGAVTVAGELLYVGSTDGRIYAVDGESGVEAARFDTRSSIWAAPLVTETGVYVAAMSGHVYALDVEDLAPVWDKKISGAGLLLDPILADDSTLLVGGIDEKLVALDPNSGDEKWSFDAGGWFWGRPLIAADSIYVPNLDGNVYALGLDGKPKWPQPFEALAPVRSAPLLAGNALIVIDKNGAAYGLDPTTGTLTWGPTLLAKTVLSDPLLLEDSVLIVAQGGDLLAINPESGSQVLVLAPQ
jgi:outer membrane protein assembly factor BamB